MSSELQPPTGPATSPIGQGSLSSALRHELEALKDHWWWFLLLGIALIVLGVIAVGAAALTTLAATVFFGALLLVGGIGQVIASFWAGRWSAFLLNLLIGVLYIVTGFMLMSDPVGGELALTLVLASMLLVSGIFRIVAALVLRFHHWGWPLLNGVVSILLGLAIFRQWPYSGLWVIGLMVGLEMIFNGWSWIMLSLGLRAAGKKAG